MLTLWANASCPSAPLLRVADMPDSAVAVAPCRVDISFEGRYRGRSANVRRRRVEANQTAGIRFEVAAHSRLCYGGAMCPARA